MAKRNPQNQSKLFNVDIDSLLISDESQDEENDSESSSSKSYKQPKKFKAKGNKSASSNKAKTMDQTSKIDIADGNDDFDDIGDYKDVSKFFESVGNDFGKTMQLRKTRLNKFSDAVLSLLESRLVEIIKKHECEIKEFNEHALDDVKEELDKMEDEFKKLKLQEDKIVKALEQQMRLFQKMTTSLGAFFGNLDKASKNLIQGFEDLKIKHRNEALDLNKSLGTDISALQNKFLIESKKEEMQIVKKYFSTMYY